MTANTQHAIDLMPQLRDILGLPGDLGLPKLYCVTFEATHDEPGWRVGAQLAWLPTDLDRWEACRAWANGVIPTVSGDRGMFRQVSTTAVVGDVSVEVWAQVGDDFEPPEQVHVTGEAVNLLIGGAA